MGRLNPFGPNSDLPPRGPLPGISADRWVQETRLHTRTLTTEMRDPHVREPLPPLSSHAACPVDLMH
jgi:hypothetical protein